MGWTVALRGAIASICIFMHCIAATAAEPLSKADREEAERHLLANWRAEEMIEASIQTRDASELLRQQSALAKEIGQSEPGAVWRGSKYCYHATAMLMNTAADLQRSMTDGMTASRLVSLRSNYKSWRDAISECEGRLGRKGRRVLTLDLDR